MKKKIDLVILAGDKNKSIKKELKGMPKSMARFNNLYFLDYLINHFSKYNFENIYILDINNPMVPCNTVKRETGFIPVLFPQL